MNRQRACFYVFLKMNRIKNDLNWVFSNKEHLRSFIVANINLIKHNLKVYKSIRESFINALRDNDADYYAFLWSFAGYYNMAIVDESYAIIFFNKMKGLHERDDKDSLDPKTIAEEMQKEGLERFEFVFASKMLNMFNDEKYPIYDSNIRVASGMVKRNKESVINYKMRIYNDIKSKYECWNTDFKDVIEEIKKNIGCESVGYMKVLDAVVWTLGRNINNEIREMEKHRKNTMKGGIES